jgi:hypothetical protein
VLNGIFDLDVVLVYFRYHFINAKSSSHVFILFATINM